MLATAKTLSLIEQKRMQWAREREEMVGLYGLWGRPKNDNRINIYNKSNLLPPIKGKPEYEDQNKADESETSGYLSDSPKHLNEKQRDEDINYNKDVEEPVNDETEECWNEKVKPSKENYLTEKKMYKNYKNEKWAYQNTELNNREKYYKSNRNFWHDTPDSFSSDDGTRLRWGDRGIGIGHLWEPVINQPECRLPLVADPYRQTPKWVEKSLRNTDSNKADILVIHHPDDDSYEQPQKNYLLGQNAPIPPEIIEERERKRKKALEHQNAIKKQLEEREMIRKQERENRIREERLEEERIKKEQEIERLRYEEEKKKMKQKEEIEKKKEEVMREAIEIAEKRAKEEKKYNKNHLVSDNSQKHYPDNDRKEVMAEQGERSNRRQAIRTPKLKKNEETSDQKSNYVKEQNERIYKDSSSQFEEIALAENFQLLNMNGLPVDGGLALMLDSPPKDNFLLPPDGVQLALLMTPRNSVSANTVMVNSPVFTGARQRILTPSKYRITERLRFNPSNKSTQTDLKFVIGGIANPGITGRAKKPNKRSGSNSGSSSSQKYRNERHRKHIRSFFTSKYRSEQISSKLSLEDRPKWGINRPSVQYKKQSEKDPYYQKKIKERLRKAKVAIISIGDVEGPEKEKEMDSVVRLVDCHTDEEEKPLPVKEEILLRNGYRMNSNLSSPMFVPIGSGLSEWEKPKTDLESERSRSNYYGFASNEDNFENMGNDAMPGSVGFLTQTQLDAIKQIASLREGLKNLQKEYTHSRSTTPYSDQSVEK